MLSENVYAKIVDVFARPKFIWALTDDRRQEFLELLSAAATWVEPLARVQDCRDSKHNRYLELTHAAGATAIVSGDNDMLVLTPWRGIEVMQPAAFVRKLGVAGPRS